MTEDSAQTDNTVPQEPAPEQEQNDGQSVDASQQKIDELQKTADTLKDQLLRKAAELENVKRRAETEAITTIRYANEGLISSLLPVLEDFSRSFKSAGKEPAGESFTRGVEMIHQKLIRILEQQGLTPFDAVGKPFDVNFHDALLQIPRADVPPGTVVEEVERGYKFNDRVLRHAKVIVSCAPPDADGKGPEA
jgi:molecular chaperone GrpE